MHLVIKFSNCISKITMLIDFMLERNASICIVQLRCVGPFLCEVWNSSVTKSIYEVELCKMTTHFALVTRQLA